MNYKNAFTGTMIALLTVTVPFSGYALTASDASQQEAGNQAIPMDAVQRFSNALGLIKKYYVKPVDDKTLFDNAIRGMVSGLDPHSSYLDEADFKELETSTNGEFGGLGIEVTMEDGVVKVITPLVDTPAFKAGIKSGDYIIKLGSKSVQGMELKDAVNIMRGKIGSPIVLTVVRKGNNKVLTFSLTREKIEIKSVKSKLLDGQYGYVRLAQFQALTDKEMKEAVAKLKKDAGGPLKGLVLDLRNNPGGLLTSAIDVSDAFLGHGGKNDKQELIVYTQGRLPGSKFTALSTNPNDILNNAPMIVLINNGSASASEIVAGALKDNKRAIILGTRSFGKGSVQTVLPLDDRRGIKLTTALYYTPSGTSIQAKGITPDIVVEEIAVPKGTEKGGIKNLNYTEADLSGHLANGNATQKANPNLPTADEGALLHEDYQLYAALTILKGLAVAQR